MQECRKNLCKLKTCDSLYASDSLDVLWYGSYVSLFYSQDIDSDYFSIVVILCKSRMLQH